MDGSHLSLAQYVPSKPWSVANVFKHPMDSDTVSVFGPRTPAARPLADIMTLRFRYVSDSVSSGSQSDEPLAHNAAFTSALLLVVGIDDSSGPTVSGYLEKSPGCA